MSEHLHAASQGESAHPDHARSAADLFAEIHSELKRLAYISMAALPPGGTLQPTALVHEVFLKLMNSCARSADGSLPAWAGDRNHLIATAARAMRQILIDAARARTAAKRGGGASRTSLVAADGDHLVLDATVIQLPRVQVSALELDDALRRYASLDERGARIVELRFFGGLGNEEIADLLGISRSTVADDWRIARAWLARELGARRDGA